MNPCALCERRVERDDILWIDCITNLIRIMFHVFLYCYAYMHDLDVDGDLRRKRINWAINCGNSDSWTFYFWSCPVTFVRLLNSSSSRKSSNIVKSLFEETWPPLIDHDNWKTMSNRPLQWRWFDVTKKPMTLTKSRPSWSTRSQSHDHQRFPAPASSSAIVLQIITPHSFFGTFWGFFELNV